MKVAQPPAGLPKESIDGLSAEVDLLEGMFWAPPLDPVQVRIDEGGEEEPTRRPHALSDVCQQSPGAGQVEVREHRKEPDDVECRVHGQAGLVLEVPGRSAVVQIMPDIPVDEPKPR